MAEEEESSQTEEAVMASDPKVSRDKRGSEVTLAGALVLEGASPLSSRPTLTMATCALHTMSRASDHQALSQGYKA